MSVSSTHLPLPAEGLGSDRIPGHWLLARLGKRVLRPGGLELTRRMLAGLSIGSADDVLEFAPGMGVTARMALGARPASYVGVDRDEAVVAQLSQALGSARRSFVRGDAHETSLPDGSVSVVYGEAMLTMQPEVMKAKIVREAFRCLRSGGRYGIHELSLVPDDLSAEVKAEIGRDLSSTIKVGARPLTVAEWRSLLEAAGFQVESIATTSMSLLETWRVLQDEGLGGSLRIVWNTLRDRQARRRVLEMRSVFRRHATRMGAVAIVARKP
ncbi:MAG TPA: methyltransferase domain-containing protein [Stenomitos sp.]